MVEPTHLKHISQFESFPQVEVKIKKCLKAPTELTLFDPAQNDLGGGFNPIEKYARQIGSSSPNRGLKSKNVWNHHQND